ncbi:MAG: tRNA (adenosine(37)-N6)-threonylcarbamoyltransferase complex dimerization subunit type 1 TsaB [Bacteroidia bacterium]|nr:tRNA (adenosine(37)-N6)-threonylcarbamoyltransferase complex dimerization subunit type 1 TsaB [Bacteroidia bacterium]
MENKRDLILLVETATELCSVALSSNGKVIAQKVSREPRSHTSVLSVLTSGLLKDSNVKTNELDAVAVSEGPGSYTGLRVGLSFAKGLCYALSKPLISVGTLDTIASIALENDKVKDNLAVPSYDPRFKDIIPAGGGMACRYEDMPDDAMVQEFNKSHMIAKMHLINRIISLATYEKDLAKV